MWVRVSCAQEHGHVQGQRASSGADPTVLWEDTKKWVDQIRKATPDKQKFLQYLQIDEQSLEAWYTGHSAPPQTTARLRQQIKLYMDKCRSERRGSGDAQHQARLTGADANHLCPASPPAPQSGTAVLLEASKELADGFKVVDL